MSKDSQTFETGHEIPYYEGAANRRMTLRTILDLGILSTVRQQAALHLPRSTKLGWVVTNYAGHIASVAPHEGETIIIGTKAVAYNKLLTERELWLRSKTGQDYARFRGLFVLMNLTTRKITTIPPELVAPYQMPYQTRLRRIQRPTKFGDGQKRAQATYRVRFFDIDNNHHVNNAVYCDWMLDPLGANFLQSHRMTDFAIRYSREVRYGQTVDSVIETKSDQAPLTTLHQIEVKGRPAANAEFKWAPLN